MALADRLLDQLECVRPVGRNGWRARCPAHKDQNPSLAISETDKVLLYCHAGCSAYEIVSAIGLELSDLFERTADSYEVGRPRTPFNAMAVLACLASDATLVYVAANYLACGQSLTCGDRQALLDAAARVRDAARKARAI